MESKIIEKLTISRKELLEILIASFFIGVCASVTGSIVFEAFKIHELWLYLGLISLFLTCIWMLSKKLTKARKANVSIKGFIIYSEKQNTLIFADRYPFSESICDYLESAFSENEALKRQWENQPLSNIFSGYRNQKKCSADASIKLVREATEYYAIENLSMHLTEYFNKEHYDKSELTELSREDVPSILLKNRFMELFSAPMENRAAFNHDLDSSVQDGVFFMPDNTSENDVIPISIWNNGAFYSRFNLILPKNTKITKDNNCIIIDSLNFKLTIETCFEGTNYLTPRNFEKYYLGLEKYEDCTEYNITFNAEVNFKLMSIFRRSKWDYHAWIDGYFEMMERKMSADYFFKTINWETVSTMIQCEQNTRND
jgi:hypothetical protein